MTVYTEREDLQNLLPDYVDLSALPPPSVIEPLDAEQIFSELLADFKSRKPDYTALVESDPVIIALECAAYREVLIRNRINEAAKASMLAHARGGDLDNLAAFYKVKRLIVDEGNPDAIPPILPTYEDDDRLRLRTQLAMESYTTTGAEKAYCFHAYSASSKVKSVKVKSPNPGEVLLTILSTENSGQAEQSLCDEVLAYLNAEDKRPLTDKVSVQSADIINYNVKAKVYIYPGPSISIIDEEIKNNLEKYTHKRHKIGEVLAYSGIYQALHTEGVQKVELFEPAQDIATSDTQAAFCTNTEIEIVTVND